MTDSENGEVFHSLMTSLYKFEKKDDSQHQSKNNSHNNSKTAKDPKEFQSDLMSNSSSFFENMLSKVKTFKGENVCVTCDDIIFSLMDESLRRVEPIIFRFDREAIALKNLALSLSYKENFEYVRRA